MEVLSSIHGLARLFVLTLWFDEVNKGFDIFQELAKIVADKVVYIRVGRALDCLFDVMFFWSDDRYGLQRVFA